MASKEKAKKLANQKRCLEDEVNSSSKGKRSKADRGGSSAKRFEEDSDQESEVQFNLASINLINRGMGLRSSPNQPLPEVNDNANNVQVTTGPMTELDREIALGNINCWHKNTFKSVNRNVGKNQVNKPKSSKILVLRKAKNNNNPVLDLQDEFDSTLDDGVLLQIKEGNLFDDDSDGDTEDEQPPTAGTSGVRSTVQRAPERPFEQRDDEDEFSEQEIRRKMRSNPHVQKVLKEMLQEEK